MHFTTSFYNESIARARFGVGKQYGTPTKLKSITRQCKAWHPLAGGKNDFDL